MNWSSDGALAENPLDPLNIVAAGMYTEQGAYNNTRSTLLNGTIGVSVTMDGGRTWSTPRTLPASPQWSNSTSPDCDQVHFADPSVTFGVNNTVFVADVTTEVSGGSVVTCHNSGNAIQSLYVSRSENDGGSWTAPVEVAGNYSGAYEDKPWIASDNHNGNVYVVYNSGGLVEFQVSYNDGLNWTAPLPLNSASLLAGSAPEVVVDPWGGVDVEWINSDGSVMFTRSANNGTSFTTPQTIARAASSMPYPESSSSPDHFMAPILPAITVDNYPGNPYTGRLFVLWQNGTGGSMGNPAIDLIYSPDNGSTWSRQVQVSSSSNLEGFQPDAAVDPNGTVYAEWYGENSTTGHYRLVGSISHDGGTTFGTPFNLSDLDSVPRYPSNQAAGGWIGDYTDIIADEHGARPIWTDARSPQEWNCTSPCGMLGLTNTYDYNISLYSAEMTYVNLSTNTPTNIRATGTAVSPTNLSSSPSYGNWLVGENYSLTAPETATAGNGSVYFSLWYGSLVSVNRTVGGNVTGALQLRACYVSDPGGACHDPGAPGELRVAITPANASVTINGVPFAVDQTTGTSEVWEEDGNYTIRAQLAGYSPVSEAVLVSPGNVSYANLTLAEVRGNLEGAVSPGNAQVTLSPAAIITLAANGSFNATLLPGNYRVIGSLSGFASASVNVSIAGNRTTWANLTLESLFGWVNGTIIPSTAFLTVNGADVAVSLDGQFSLSLPPGTVWLNGSAPGYLPVSSGPFILAPLGHLMRQLWLPLATGQVLGTVSPGAASVHVNGTPVPTTSGAFNLTLDPGNYSYSASAPGYSSGSGTIEVVDNTTVQIAIVLAVAPGWLSSVVTPASAVVTIDGQGIVVNSSGTFNVTLAAGPHELVVSATGYRTLEEVVVVPAGATLHVSLILTLQSTTLLSMVYYMALIVAAVAIIGVGAVVWRRQRGKAPKRLAPLEEKGAGSEAEPSAKNRP